MLSSCLSFCLIKWTAFNGHLHLCYKQTKKPTSVSNSNLRTFADCLKSASLFTCTCSKLTYLATWIYGFFMYYLDLPLLLWTPWISSMLPFITGTPGRVKEACKSGIGEDALTGAKGGTWGPMGVVPLMSPLIILWTRSPTELWQLLLSSSSSLLGVTSSSSKIRLGS